MRSERKTPAVREYLTAERTQLAYARTSLAMMGFGFVIARFSLFLREIPVLSHNAMPASPWVVTLGGDRQHRTGHCNQWVLGHRVPSHHIKA